MKLKALDQSIVKHAQQLLETNRAKYIKRTQLKRDDAAILGKVDFLYQACLVSAISFMFLFSAVKLKIGLKPLLLMRSTTRKYSMMAISTLICYEN